MSDQLARIQAIDPNNSYIVQAPAGSGKTELLTQRVLKLLAVVQNPEEVVAITFTRKAAREMQQRIIEALQSANLDMPEELHKQETWKLAKDVIKHDREFEWGLLNNPSRLRVLTFDALSAMISNKMPLLSRFGSQVNPSDSPYQLYNDAASAALEGLKFDEPWAESIQVLLAHTDNRYQYLQELLAQQLAKRDQWLRLENEGFAEREHLEQGFVQAINLKLHQANDCLAQSQKDKLLKLLIFSANYQADDSELVALKQLLAWPQPEIENLALWQAIANFCLTKSSKKYRAKGQVPKKNQAENKADRADIDVLHKQAKELFLELTEIPQFAEYLQQIRNLPQIHYQESQWQVIEALIELMKIASAYLTLEFKKTGQVDFTEVAMAAERALGELGDPSELALKLDYSISHLLIDEFQDTSFSQFHLIEKLTAGWQSEDGRSLFIVGDPMQSVYRFREANVGLFIQAREQGLADIKLKFLQLTRNFRSSETIVSWVNKSFSKIFPKQDSLIFGAVSLALAESTISAQEEDKVQFQCFFEESEQTEAEYIAHQIESCLKQDPKQSIAILIRARTHAVEIMQQLKAQGIGYSSEQIEQLSEQQVVLDLLTISRILLHPLDQIAWLALLKSPYFGLSLADISYISNQFKDDISQVFKLVLYADEEIAGLSSHGQKIIKRQASTLLSAIDKVHRIPLSIQVEQLWLALGGTLTLQSEYELDDIYAFLDLLRELEKQELVFDYAQIESALEKLYASNQGDSQTNVCFMTMHKSKGLEFDTVFLPQLAKSTSSNSKSLMVWEEFPDIRGGSQYLIAPINQSGEQQSLYKLVNDFSNEKSRYENARLLYVAATRAKKKLYLSANLKHSYNKKQDKNIVSAPSADSLISFLMPIYHTAMESELLKVEGNFSDEPIIESPEQYSQNWPALENDWKLASIENPIESLNFEVPKKVEKILDFDWAGDIAVNIGLVVHRQLELLAQRRWINNSENIESLLSDVAAELLEKGHAIKDINYAKKRIKVALKNIHEDKNAQWLLSDHQEARCEWALTGYVDEYVGSYVIDRTFIDDSGNRWIIDYKTGTHLDEDKESFIQIQVERYKSQLEKYQQLLEQLEDRPIKKALYFPMLKELVEV